MKKPMKIVIAPDSFKECLGAAEVAGIIVDELRALASADNCIAGAGQPFREILECPLSDGGEGFTEILSRHWKAEKVPVVVTGPLGGPVRTWYGKAGETAIVDAASVCGLSLVPVPLRNPLHTTTKGLGEILLAAYRDGCRKAIIGLGGSATCDGGMGLMEAEGPLAPGTPALPVRALAGKMEIRVLCDVTNPFVGPQGAARVFGPQKGADAATVEVLEERLERMAARIRRETGKDIRTVPGSGAAGGLAGALMAWFDAELLPGIDSMLTFTGFRKMIEDADVIVTGEGKSDSQTLSGKVPFGVLQAARLSGRPVPVLLFSGIVEDREALLQAGFSRVVQITPPSVPRDRAIQPDVASRHLRQAVARVDFGACVTPFLPAGQPK